MCSICEMFFSWSLIVSIMLRFDSVAIFAIACFGHPSPSKRRKVTRQVSCLRRLWPSCTSIVRDPARGSRTSLQSTLRLIRETDCLFPRLMLDRISLGKLNLTCAFQRLKIFTSLTLRFQDFQRMQHNYLPVTILNSTCYI